MPPSSSLLPFTPTCTLHHSLAQTSPNTSPALCDGSHLRLFLPPHLLQDPSSDCPPTLTSLLWARRLCPAHSPWPLPGLLLSASLSGESGLPRQPESLSLGIRCPATPFRITGLCARVFTSGQRCYWGSRSTVHTGKWTLALSPLSVPSGRETSLNTRGKQLLLSQCRLLCPDTGHVGLRSCGYRRGEAMLSTSLV